MTNSARADEGFSLVEMLMVLVLIGILSGISYVALASSRSSTVQNTCKTAYQALSLGVASFQSDNNGSLPTSIAALEPSYINAGLVASYAANFTLQVGSFAVTNEALAANVATLTFTSAYVPPITVKETIQVAGVDSVNLDGTWKVLSFDGSGPTYTVTFAITPAVTPAVTIDPTAVSSSGAVLNALTNAANSYDVYVFDSSANRLGTTAPTDCTLLK